MPDNPAAACLEPPMYIHAAFDKKTAELLKSSAVHQKIIVGKPETPFAVFFIKQAYHREYLRGG